VSSIAETNKHAEIAPDGNN